MEVRRSRFVSQQQRKIRPLKAFNNKIAVRYIHIEIVLYSISVQVLNIMSNCTKYKFQLAISAIAASVQYQSKFLAKNEKHTHRLYVI